MLQKYADYKVIGNEEVSPNIFKLKVEGSFEITPGQFFMLRGWKDEPFLSRPISVHDADDKTVSFLYEVKGKGTEILKELKNGDTIKLTGPLGKGFDTEKINGKVAVITGGIGIAPMIYTAKCLKNANVDFYAGFRDTVYLKEEMEKNSDRQYITTETGSYGEKGYVTDLFNPWEYNIVLCCGPKPMMKRVIDICKKSGTPVLVSMEEKMACGIGACLGCTCKTAGGNKRVCKDGPVFWGRDVVIDA